MSESDFFWNDEEEQAKAEEFGSYSLLKEREYNVIITEVETSPWRGKDGKEYGMINCKFLVNDPRDKKHGSEIWYQGFYFSPKARPIFASLTKAVGVKGIRSFNASDFMEAVGLKPFRCKLKHNKYINKEGDERTSYRTSGYSSIDEETREVLTEKYGEKMIPSSFVDVDRDVDVEDDEIPF